MIAVDKTRTIHITQTVTTRKADHKGTDNKKFFYSTLDNAVIYDTDVPHTEYRLYNIL